MLYVRIIIYIRTRLEITFIFSISSTKCRHNITRFIFFVADEYNLISFPRRLRILKADYEVSKSVFNDLIVNRNIEINQYL